MNIITDRQITWNDGSFPKKYDTVKVFEEGRKYYKHGDETFATKSALRRALSSEYGGAWIEEKDAKKRYFIDESGWLQRSIREVSKEEFTQKLEPPSTWKKVFQVGLGVCTIGWAVSELLGRVEIAEEAIGLAAIGLNNPNLGVLGCSLVLSGAYAQITPISSVFRVNTNTASHQLHQDIASLQNDEYVVTWTSYHTGGSMIYAQQFQNESKVGGERLLNAITSGEQSASVVAGLKDGGFVSGWMYQNSIREIIARLFNDSTTPTAGQFRVNAISGNTLRPAVAPLSNGKFVFVWYVDSAIKGQVFLANGSQDGGEFLISSSGTTPVVAPRPDGGFFVVWDERDNIFGRFYEADNQPTNSSFVIATNLGNYLSDPFVKALKNGRYMVTWLGGSSIISSTDIYGQMLDDSGNLIGAEILVSSTSITIVDSASSVDLADGSCIIFWSGESGNYDIMGQRYLQNGTQADEAVVVGNPSSGNQLNPRAISLLNNRIVVSWEENDGNGNGVFAQLFAVNISDRIPSSVSLTTTNQSPSTSLLLSRSSLSRSRASSISSQDLLTNTPLPNLTTGSLASSLGDSPSSNSLAISLPSSADLFYGQSYPLSVNGEQIGMYTISGGSRLLNSTNSNVLNIQFNPGFAPEENEIIPLFSIPSGQATDWQSIQLGDTDFECLEAHAEINPSTSGSSDFGLVFTGADSCRSSAPGITATTFSLITS